MTIGYDAERRCATDLASGLAVQWVRDEPAQERRTHFKLIVNGVEIPFEASYDFGEAKIKAQHPEMDAIDRHKLVSALREMNYKSSNIPGQFDRNTFLRVWHFLVSRGSGVYRFTTSYNDFVVSNANAANEWRFGG